MNTGAHENVVAATVQSLLAWIVGPSMLSGKKANDPGTIVPPVTVPDTDASAASVGPLVLNVCETRYVDAEPGAERAVRWYSGEVGVLGNDGLGDVSDAACLGVRLVGARAREEGVRARRCEGKEDPRARARLAGDGPEGARDVERCGGAVVG